MIETPISFEILRNIENKSQIPEYEAAFLACIFRAFGHPMPEKETDDAMKGELIAVAKTEDNVVGFVTLERKTAGDFKKRKLSEYDTQALRFTLGSGVVDRSYHGQGIYRRLNELRIKYALEHKPVVLTTTTQNPRVEKSAILLLEDLVQASVLKSFTVERVLIPKLYDRQLTAYQIPVENTPFENLDINAGDGYSLLFHLQYPEQG